ncbi:hypothetical protein ACIQVA_38000 [Streptomyces microflavus]|uniref:hypothetical protein n=1 Tax=Streptomyces microflavus TaxID=1919 RepID=UPI00381FE9F5
MSVLTLPLPQMPPPQAPACDMKDLAARVRALFCVREHQSSRVPLGGRLFDVVVTGGGRPGRAAVARMDEIQHGSCGPVIEDRSAGWLYWLVPPGTASTWDYHAFGLCIGSPHTLTLPALDRGEPPGPYWLRPCVSDRLVPPQQLRALLCQIGSLPASHGAVQAHLSAAQTLGLQEEAMPR